MKVAWAAAIVLASACAPGPAPADTAAAAVACTVLFGTPNTRTGLTTAQCQPACACDGKDFAPPAYTSSQVDDLLAWQLTDTVTQITKNPYDHPQQHVPQPGNVCAFVPGAGRAYSLQTFPTLAAAQAAGAHVTHGGACGVCSPLTDLAVYIRQPDLTDPVRQCALSGDQQATVDCLRDLGFDLPCAQIWYWNTLNTRQNCLDACMANFNAPYHHPDGTLNACLQCDEDKSGEVFKAVAGRTRRNTGVPSSMCRPCAEVLPLVHVYP